MIRNQGRPLMPHEVLWLVLDHIESSPGGQTQQASSLWELVVQWCVVAAQHDAQGDSLSFSVEAITKGDDAYFGQWVEQRLDGTLGKRPLHEGRQGATQGGADHG
jgi:hypothetical protein